MPDLRQTTYRWHPQADNSSWIGRTFLPIRMPMFIETQEEVVIAVPLGEAEAPTPEEVFEHQRLTD